MRNTHFIRNEIIHFEKTIRPIKIKSNKQNQEKEKVLFLISEYMLISPKIFIPGETKTKSQLNAIY